MADPLFGIITFGLAFGSHVVWGHSDSLCLILVGQGGKLFYMERPLPTSILFYCWVGSLDSGVGGGGVWTGSPFEKLPFLKSSQGSLHDRNNQSTPIKVPPKRPQTSLPEVWNLQTYYGSFTLVGHGMRTVFMGFPTLTFSMAWQLNPFPSVFLILFHWKLFPIYLDD